MDNIQFTDFGNPITLEDLARLEDRFNIIFPAQYRDFLLRNNGGIPNKVYFSTQENDYVINQFFSISDGDDSFQSYYIQFEPNLASLHTGLIPLADDVFGNLICISFGQDDNGYIYFWNHEIEVLTFLSKDLDTFLNDLLEDI